MLWGDWFIVIIRLVLAILGRFFGGGGDVDGMIL